MRLKMPPDVAGQPFFIWNQDAQRELVIAELFQVADGFECFHGILLLMGVKSPADPGRWAGVMRGWKIVWPGRAQLGVVRVDAVCGCRRCDSRIFKQ